MLTEMTDIKHAKETADMFMCCLSYGNKAELEAMRDYYKSVSSDLSQISEERYIAKQLLTLVRRQLRRF